MSSKGSPRALARARATFRRDQYMVAAEHVHRRLLAMARRAGCRR